MSTPRRREGELRLQGGQDARALRRLLLRNVVGAGILIALVAILVEALIGSPEAGAQQRSSFSPRADGFRGLFQVQRRLGYRTQRLRGSYGSLPRPASRHTLLILDPTPSAFLPQAPDAAQLRALAEWVAEGGNVLVALPGRAVVPMLGGEVDVGLEDGAGELLAALAGDPTPETCWGPAFAPLRGEGPLAAFRGELPPLPPRKEWLVSSSLRHAGGTALGAGVERIGAGPVELRRFAPELPAGFAPLMTLAEEPLAVEGTRGAGRVVLLASCYPLTNLALYQGGSGPFAGALLHHASEGGRRSLVFDEYAHGLVLRRGLFGMLGGAHLAYPLGAALLLVLVVGWQGAVRAAAPRGQRTLPRRAKEEFVISLADLAQRAGRHRAAAGWILAAHRQRLPEGALGTPQLVDLQAELARTQGPFREAELVQLSARVHEAVDRTPAGTPQPEKAET